MSMFIPRMYNWPVSGKFFVNKFYEVFWINLLHSDVGVGKVSPVHYANIRKSYANVSKIIVCIKESVNSWTWQMVLRNVIASAKNIILEKE